MSSQRVVVLTLVKIFNWNQSGSSNTFQVSFHSVKTCSLILSKSIRGTISQSEVLFNYSLRVAYQPDENELCIVLSHYAPNKAAMVELAQFDLNLDNLANKKLQFFPFGRNDKVLKIAAGYPDKTLLPVPEMPPRTNDRFIREREDFVRKMVTTASSSLPTAPHPTSLSHNRPLNNHQRFKYSKNTPRESPHKAFNEYYESWEESPGGNLNRGTAKSSSVVSLGARGLVKRRQGDESSSNRSNRSQKHRLMLRNLEMVPCTNEYYDQEEEAKGRTSDMLPRTTNSQKRMFRSQFY